MALPTDDTNPFIAVNLPLVLDAPPSTNSAVEALRMGILGFAALHEQSIAERSPHASPSTVDEISFADSASVRAIRSMVECRRSSWKRDATRRETWVEAGTRTLPAR